MTEGKEHAKNNSDVRATVNLLQDNLNDWMADVGPNERHELEILEGARKWHGEYRKITLNSFLLTPIFLTFSVFAFISFAEDSAANDIAHTIFKSL